MNCIGELNPGQNMTLPIVVDNGLKHTQKLATQRQIFNQNTMQQSTQIQSIYKHINKQQPKHVSRDAIKNKPRQKMG